MAARGAAAAAARAAAAAAAVATTTTTTTTAASRSLSAAAARASPAATTAAAAAAAAANAAASASASASASRSASSSSAAAAAAGRTFLVDGRRTPFGKFGGTLKDESPVALGVAAVGAALEATGVSAEAVDHVLCANVIPSTPDTIYAARHVALKVGVPEHVPAYSLNRLCGSGVQVISEARHLIERGEAQCVAAFGVESMSMIPHLQYGTRFGTRFGPVQSVDFLMESLSDKHAGAPMAITAENLSQDHDISREACDEYSLGSHNKAAAAYEAGHFADEVAPMKVGRKETLIEKDEHVRYDCALEDMSKLKPAFQKGGVVTPGTASGIVDGAAAVLVASEEFCNRHSLTPLAEVGTCTVVGVDPTRMGRGPVPAIRELLKRTGLTLEDIDRVEINEAFAAQVLACAKELGLDMNTLNSWGGAIALGHPLGASGVRVALTAARQLQRLGGNNAIASACIGGGQGIAMHLKRD